MDPSNAGAAVGTGGVQACLRQWDRTGDGVGTKLTTSLTNAVDSTNSYRVLILVLPVRLASAIAIIVLCIVTHREQLHSSHSSNNQAV